MKFTTIFAAGLALASTSAFGQGFLTSESSYLNATSTADFTFQPIVTVGDRVPLTGGLPGAEFAFAGIPDAMGIYKDSVTGENVLFCAHELGNSTVTTPVVGATALRGAFVSRYVLANSGAVLNGGIAHRDLYLENTFQANRPPQSGDSVAFTRFCSGAFAGREHGMDRPLFFTNEETFGQASYETARGAQTVVVADGKMYTVPDLGRIGRETSIVQPRRDDKTVIISTEDAGAPSYVYMYVGTKLRRSSSVLDKNGLTNGKVYVLCGRDAQHNEGTYTSGSLPVKWVEIVGGGNMTDANLLAAADSAGAFGFVRVEDAEFDPKQPTRSLFLATTGGSASNRLGRLYELTMNPTNPIANGTLNVVYNADTIIYPTGSYSGAVAGTLTGGSPTGSLGTYTPGTIGTTDYPVSIDNIAVSKDFIVVQEDRNSPADAVFANFGRNGGLWTLNRNAGYAAKLQSTFNYAYVQSRDSSTGHTAGLWESSGVIASDAIFGPGTFVLNVQGHIGSGSTRMRSNISKPGGGTYTQAEAVSLFTEDGQVLIMRPVNP
jgi:hypothetical protein